MEIWEPKPPGTLWATPGLLRDCFIFCTFYFFIYLTPVPASHSSPFTSSHLALVFFIYKVIVSTSHFLSLRLLNHTFLFSLLALPSSTLSLFVIPLRFAFL